MLFLLGALSFEIWPLNPTGTDSENGGDYVEKPVMGRRPPLEFVGEATESLSFSVALFPENGRACGNEKDVAFGFIALEARPSTAKTQHGVRFADVLPLTVPVPTLPVVQIVLPFPQYQAGLRVGRDEYEFP